jgi:hypothetical protein
MFERAFGREPSAAERDRVATLAADLRAEHATAPDAELRTWRDVAQALFNLKEFVYVR